MRLRIQLLMKVLVLSIMALIEPLVMVPCKLAEMELVASMPSV